MEAHFPAFRQACLQVLAGCDAVGGLGGLRSIDAGESHGDRPTVLAHLQRVSIPDREHHGAVHHGAVALGHGQRFWKGRSCQLGNQKAAHPRQGDIEWEVQNGHAVSLTGGWRTDRVPPLAPQAAAVGESFWFVLGGYLVGLGWGRVGQMPEPSPKVSEVTFAWVIVVSAAMLRVSQTLPPIWARWPMVTRPRIVAPA